MHCAPLTWLSANCRCGADATHFVTKDGNIADPAFCCERHCPVHGGEVGEFEGEAETITGTQENLF